DLTFQRIVVSEQDAAHPAGADEAEHPMARETLRQRFFRRRLLRGIGSAIERGVEVLQRAQLDAELRREVRVTPAKALDLGALVARAQIENLRNRQSETLLAVAGRLPALARLALAHRRAPDASSSRRRFTARWTRSAASARDFPSRSAISPVESPST